MMRCQHHLGSPPHGRGHLRTDDRARLGVQAVERLVSSSKRRSATSARATSARRNWPYDSSRARRRARPRKPTSARRRRASLRSATVGGTSSPMLECSPETTISSAVQAVAEYVACSSGDTTPTARFHSETGVPDGNPWRSIRPPAAGLRSP